MVRLLYTFLTLTICISGFSQAKVDLDRSVPVWMEFDVSSNEATLKWIGDGNATNYYVSQVGAFQNLIPIATLDGTATEFKIGILNPGGVYNYHIQKDVNGRGIINVGIEVPAVHQRGRCLVVIDDLLAPPLENEIEQLMEDIEMDGWTVDTLHVSQSDEVVNVKSRIVEWYDDGYEFSQSVFLLGHVPVPYSGNTAHDGHGNHQGAWAADMFYADADGNWTDFIVNNTTPSRDANKNVPGDGKYDQTKYPSILEMEIGRVDFNNMPAFQDDEIELTRKYLNKNHAFKIGNKEYPRRALVENNFSSFPEGFGQSAWRNYPSMFGGDSVSTQNYDVVLETEKYLCSYACGGGSYTSAAGIGSTSNLWAAKDLQTVFTMTFGSYFGDWDSQNNFLRGALGSGDILTNAWAGRPVWQFFDMGLGHHIGLSAIKSQAASGSFYNQGNSSQSAHIALMGDPTLRLHPMKPAQNLNAVFIDGDIELTWDVSNDGSDGYFVYKKEAGTDWSFLVNLADDATKFSDYCVKPNTSYSYMVKAVKLEHSGCGSYFNTSLGIATPIVSGDNPNYTAYYPDADMDGFGDPNGLLYECVVPPGFSENGLDCDDTNSEINPNGIEIPNNGIDEDCNGEDLLVSLDELEFENINIYPNPTSGILFIEGLEELNWSYSIYNSLGIRVSIGKKENRIDLQSFENGIYWIELSFEDNQKKITRPVILVK